MISLLIILIAEEIKMLRKLSIGLFTALIIACLLLPAAAFAEEPDGNAGPAEQTAPQPAERTILMCV